MLLNTTGGKLAAVGAAWIAAWLLAPAIARALSSKVTASQYVSENGTCFRVDLYASGAARHVVVDDDLCNSSPDLTI